MAGLPASRLRDLPSVDQVLKVPLAAAAVQRFGRQATTEAVREALAKARAACRAGAAVPEPGVVAADALAQLEAGDVPSLRPVFNLTGTVLHTNLGRALIAEAAIEAVNAAMQRCGRTRIRRRHRQARRTGRSSALARLRTDRSRGCDRRQQQRRRRSARPQHAGARPRGGRFARRVDRDRRFFPDA